MFSLPFFGMVATNLRRPAIRGERRPVSGPDPDFEVFRNTNASTGKSSVSNRVGSLPDSHPETIHRGPALNKSAGRIA